MSERTRPRGPNRRTPGGRDRDRKEDLREQREHRTAEQSDDRRPNVSARPSAHGQEGERRAERESEQDAAR